MKACLKVILVILTFGINAQNISIRDIDYRSNVYLAQTGENALRLIYKTQKRDQILSHFRKLDFDTLLQVHDTTEIQLQGKFRLLASTESERFMVTAFGSDLAMQLQLHWVERVTEKQHITKLQLANLYSKRTQVRVHPSSDPDAFFVLYSVDKREWEVRLISSDGKIKSKQSIRYGSDKVNIVNSNFINDDLALVVGRNAASRKAQYEWRIINGATGVDEQTKTLSDKTSKLAIDNSLLVDSTLYLSGRRFFGNRFKRNASGLPSLVSYDAKTNSFTDQQLGSSAFPVKIFWMDLVVTPDGRKYLVGESFVSEAFGGYLTKAILTSIATVGMLSVTWSSLKWQEVFIMPVDADRTAPTILTLQRRRVQVGTHMPAFDFAGYAYNTGQVRYFGHDKEGSLYLLDGGTFKKYLYPLKEFVELGQLPAPMNSKVLFLSDSYSIVYTRSSGKLNLATFNYQQIARRK